MILNGLMVKRKVEIVPYAEESDLRAGLTMDPTHSEPRASTSSPTGGEARGGPTVSHVGPTPTTVAEEGTEAADVFWALLAVAGYQVW